MLAAMHDKICILRSTFVWANSAPLDSSQGQMLARKSLRDVKHFLYLSDWLYEVSEAKARFCLNPKGWRENMNRDELPIYPQVLHLVVAEAIGNRW